VGVVRIVDDLFRMRDGVSDKQVVLLLVSPSSPHTWIFTSDILGLVSRWNPSDQGLHRIVWMQVRSYWLLVFVIVYWTHFILIVFMLLLKKLWLSWPFLGGDAVVVVGRVSPALLLLGSHRVAVQVFAESLVVDVKLHIILILRLGYHVLLL